MKIKALSSMMLLIGTVALAQILNIIRFPLMEKPSVRKEIKIPDIAGYHTLKCDFHMHTVFSDGIVWPTFRVEEAWEEGLDAIAITTEALKAAKKQGAFMMWNHPGWEAQQPDRCRWWPKTIS